MLLAASCSAVKSGSSDLKANKFPTELARQLGEVLDAKLEKAGAPGATVTVVLADGSKWIGSEGWANVETETPVRPADRFRIGSITKTFNAALVLQLVEEGKVTLDDPIHSWLPEFGLSPAITIRHLLSHTSGIFNYTDNTKFLVQGPATPAQVIDFAQQNDSAFPPGENWSYSNTGFFLTGLLIEHIEKKPFHRVVRERLLQPLLLDNIFMDGMEEPHSPITDIVNGYVLGADIAIVSPDADMTWAWAAGGMVASGEDLCLWATALLFPAHEEAAVLQQASRQAMQTAHVLNDGTKTSYGLGLSLPQRAGRPVMGHTGSTLGFKGELFVDTARKTCVALLTNDFTAEMQHISNAIWQTLDAFLTQNEEI